MIMRKIEFLFFVLSKKTRYFPSYKHVCKEPTGLASLGLFSSSKQACRVVSSIMCHVWLVSSVGKWCVLTLYLLSLLSYPSRIRTRGPLCCRRTCAIPRRVARGGGLGGLIEPPNNCAVTSKKRLHRQLASAALRFGGLALLPV